MSSVLADLKDSGRLASPGFSRVAVSLVDRDLIFQD
jgi:hypothetical protein